MTAPTKPTAVKRSPNKKFLGGHFDKKLVSDFEAFATEKYFGNKTLALGQIIESAVRSEKKSRR